MQLWNSHQQMKPSFLRAASTEWQPRQIRYLRKEELSANRVRNVLPQTVTAMWRALPMQCKCGAEQRRRRASSSCVVMIGSQAPLFSSHYVCRASASSTQSSGPPLWRRRQSRQLFHVKVRVVFMPRQLLKCFGQSLRDRWHLYSRAQQFLCQDWEGTPVMHSIISHMCATGHSLGQWVHYRVLLVCMEN